MRVLRLCSVYGPATLPIGEGRGFDVVGGMQVHTTLLTAALDDRGIRQTVMTAYRPEAARVESLGRHAQVLRRGVPARRFRQLYAVSSIPDIARLKDVDLVHVHLGEDLAIMPLGVWAAKETHARLVVTVHCSLRHTLVSHDLRTALLRSLGGAIELRLLRAAAAVMVLNDRLVPRLEAVGVPRSELHLLPLGIDLDALRRSHARPASMDGRRWIVYAGRVVRAKGVRDLIDAFARLTSPDVGLLVVGDGDDSASVASIARRAGLERNVRFVGMVPHTDIPAYLHHADVVVLPSWYEERGRILLEAMAAGAPVVATRTGGIPATVTDGENGILVPPRDPDRLAVAIERVLGSQDLAASLVARGRVTASGHGVEALVEATLRAYRSALGRPNDPRGGRGALVKIR